MACAANPYTTPANHPVFDYMSAVGTFARNAEKLVAWIGTLDDETTIAVAARHLTATKAGEKAAARRPGIGALAPFDQRRFRYAKRTISRFVAARDAFGPKNDYFTEETEKRALDAKWADLNTTIDPLTS
jgi:hypothetical protein